MTEVERAMGRELIATLEQMANYWWPSKAIDDVLARAVVVFPPDAEGETP